MVAAVIYDRKTGEIAEEKVFESGATRFLYDTVPGGVCLAFLRLPAINRLYGAFQKSGWSKKKIEKLVRDYDMGEIQSEYASFNDFITRKEARGFEGQAHVFIAPADSCMIARTIEKGVVFSIKGRNYLLSRFLGDEQKALAYEGGLCLIFRLRVYDYHRFCFVDDGIIQSEKQISGFLDSVNTNQTGRFTLSSNSRRISHLRLANFGDIVFAEVGAMLVGRIVHTYSGASFHKGDEKGYFEFGGSSIVILIKKGVVKVDDDILAYSAKGIETKVEYGERIGIKYA
jgi:phosphatidylserine decarboxylase